MLIPYRAKNPPEHFPTVTLSLIAANTLIFALTSHLFLTINRGVVQQFALSHETMSVLRLFTAMFLHGDLLHLLGNMLFLWIFGTSVEGRLKPAKFLGVYLLCGVAGGLLHDVVIGIMHPKQFGLGASGAIMGVAGAYLYMFPFARICVFFAYFIAFIPRMRLMEWQAQWVILYFIGFDLLYGMLSKSGYADGVAHFAHLGGFGAGFLAVMLLKARRDSEDYADAQAMRSDARGDYHAMALHELETLMENPQDNVPLVMTFCAKAAKQYDGSGLKLCLNTLNRHSRLLLEQADPEDLARLVLAIPEHAGALPSAFYMRLGGRLESAGLYDLAARAYRRIYEINPRALDSEMALLKLARLAEQTAPDKAQAASLYGEMLRQFPNGALAMQGHDALRRLQASGFVFSAGNAAAALSTTAPSVPPSAAVLVPAPAATDPDTAPIQAPTGVRAGLAVTDPLRNPPPAAFDDDLLPVGGSRSFDDDVRPLGS